MKPIDKRELLARLTARLADERDALAEAQRQTQEGATHEENRAEDDKDTRATEASYLARGQAQRVEAIEAELALLRAMPISEPGPEDPVALSALVELSARSGTLVVFLVPAGGGQKLELNGQRIQTLTPESPLGRLLIGAELGDTIELERGTSTVWYEVAELA